MGSKYRLIISPLGYSALGGTDLVMILDAQPFVIV